MPKPLECSLCKEIETVRHLFFDCIVATCLWADVKEIFDIMITDFYSLASKWLCNRRYMQLNVVSSVVLWTVWNNRNNIVFNRKSLINLKQVWSLALTYLRNWKVPYKDSDWELVDSFAALLRRRLQSPLELEPG